MRKINYHLISPDGNTTAIVRDEVPEGMHLDVVRIIMETVSEVEAVGFIEGSDHKDASFRLRMMGGEFCGNAIRSAALLKGRNRSLQIESSGIEELVEVETGDDVSTIRVPGEVLKNFRFVAEGIIVVLEGISHLLIASENRRDMTESIVNKYKGDLPAFGVIYVMRGDSNQLSIDPHIWVRDTETLVHETACSSGSMAAAVMEFIRRGKTELTVEQPSGKLYRVKLDINDDKIETISLSSGITYLKEGSIEIE